MNDVRFRSLTGVLAVAESDVDSSEWPMEQDEAIDSLLCETPSLLPTLCLSLGSQTTESPTAVAPAAATAAATPTQTTINNHNQSKGIKVRARGLMLMMEADIFGRF